MRRWRLTTLALWIIGASAFATMQRTEFLETIGKKAREAKAAETSVVRGKDGWLFFAPELRSLSVGGFWGDAAAKVSRASNAEYADPFPAILDFHEQLKSVGIRLIFVPVPAKAAVYPDKIDDRGVNERADAVHRAFYDLLEEKGVEVLDLTPIFHKARESSAEPLYCKQDTHWSGVAVKLAAEEIAKRVGEPDWANGVDKSAYRVAEQRTTITGDLWTALDDTSVEKEALLLYRVTAGGNAPVETWRESPVLLLGDSHNLVFHEGGDMHATGAGLADHLAANLGFPVDLVGVRGSGATPSRLSLYRRRDNLAGKKLVVWCLSVREFTEGQGWRKVPVIGK